MPEDLASTRQENVHCGDLPPHIRMTDLLLEQIELSAPVFIRALKDVQTVYIRSMRAMLKAGQMAGKGSENQFDIGRNLEQAFEDMMPAILQAQVETSKVFVEIAQENIRLMRDILKGSHSWDW